jgi:hypothetical protein
MPTMATLVVAEIVTPKTLDSASKAMFIDSLYEVHCRIFAGVDKKSFVKYVVDSQAEHTSIQLYRGEAGELVGYFAVHVFERALGGRTVAILRGEAGILRSHRGGNAVIGFGIDRIVRYMASHPGRPMYYFGSLVHPSSYAQIERYADRLWPNPEVETPADIANLMMELGESFGLERVDEASALVRKVGWQTRDSSADRHHWSSSDKPAVRFFLAQNPAYTEGHGLLTLVPITAGGLARGASRYAGAKAQRRAQRMAASLRARLQSSLRSSYPPVASTMAAWGSS